MSKIVIAAHKLGKAYQVPKAEDDPQHQIEVINHKPFYETFWALRDVSFEVREGEIIGIIGANGAGKTTLLKILSRVSHPTEGWAEVRGRLGSLLQVGAGFHAELSGRENIHLNGAILGMSRGDINKRMSDIIDFAEVGRFIDFPLKHYSSGMAARLAFSVAAHLEPEILILDEVLSVGDAAFQQKCQQKMRGVIREGRTVLIVSHNLTMLPDLCTRAFLIKGGRLIHQGSLESALNQYLGSSEGASISLQNRAKLVVGEDGKSTGSQPNTTCIEVQKMRSDQEVNTLLPCKASLCDKDGNNRRAFNDNEPISVLITFECLLPIENFRSVVCIRSVNEEALLVSNSPTSTELAPGVYTLNCRIPPDLLWPRNYLIDIILINRGVERITVKRAFEFRIVAVSPESKSWPEAWVRHRLLWAQPEKTQLETSELAQSLAQQ